MYWNGDCKGLSIMMRNYSGMELQVSMVVRYY